MLQRLRKALRGRRRGEVLGGDDSDDTAFAGAATAGGVGAVSDRHRPSTRPEDDLGAGPPAHGDDEFAPRVPPDRSS
jgi:hypothetical protein